MIYAYLHSKTIFRFPLSSLPPPPNFLSSKPLHIHTYDHDHNDDFWSCLLLLLVLSGMTSEVIPAGTMQYNQVGASSHPPKFPGQIIIEHNKTGGSAAAAAILLMS